VALTSSPLPPLHLLTSYSDFPLFVLISRLSTHGVINGLIISLKVTLALKSADGGIYQNTRRKENLSSQHMYIYLTGQYLYSQVCDKLTFAIYSNTDICSESGQYFTHKYLTHFHH
jgi:hypothetical protein